LKVLSIEFPEGQRVFRNRAKTAVSVPILSQSERPEKPIAPPLGQYLMRLRQRYAAEAPLKRPSQFVTGS